MGRPRDFSLLKEVISSGLNDEEEKFLQQWENDILEGDPDAQLAADGGHTNGDDESDASVHTEDIEEDKDSLISSSPSCSDSEVSNSENSSPNQHEKVSEAEREARRLLREEKRSERKRNRWGGGGTGGAKGGGKSSSKMLDEEAINAKLRRRRHVGPDGNSFFTQEQRLAMAAEHAKHAAKKLLQIRRVADENADLETRCLLLTASGGRRFKRHGTGGNAGKSSGLTPGQGRNIDGQYGTDGTKEAISTLDKIDCTPEGEDDFIETLFYFYGLQRHKERQQLRELLLRQEATAAAAAEAAGSSTLLGKGIRQKLKVKLQEYVEEEKKVTQGLRNNTKGPRSGSRLIPLITFTEVPV